jgi:hypothetical protein
LIFLEQARYILSSSFMNKLYRHCIAACASLHCAMRKSASNNLPAKAKKKPASVRRRTSKNACGLIKAAWRDKTDRKLSNHGYESKDDTEKDEDDVKEARKLTMKEKEAMGFLVATQEEMRIAVKVCYIHEFHEPDENDWPNIIKHLCTRFGLNYSSIKQVFTSCCSGHKHPKK